MSKSVFSTSTGLALVLAASGLGLASQAYAQTPPTASVQEEVTGLDEIVVTANRRSQVLSDVGVSVTAVSGETLTARAITSTADLAKAVPGFTASDTSLNVPVYSIRGVGLNDSSLASNSTVAIAVDEVPLPYTAMTQGSVLDLQRLEVLKGPQGTLYGQNATGGAINYIANKPTDDFRAGATVGFGRFNTVTSEAYVSGPITDTLKARLAVSSIQGGDWQQSMTRVGDTLGETNKVMGRLQLAWQPTERLYIDFIVSGWADRSDTTASQLVAFRPQNAANAFREPGFFASRFAPADARAADWDANRDYSRDDSFYQLALKAQYDIAENVVLTSITAYSAYDTKAFTDRDGTPFRNFNAPTLGSIESFYQEVRLSGETEKLTWSVGANYRNDSVFDLQRNEIGDATNSYSAGIHFEDAIVFGNQDVETYAAFADGEYQLFDKLSIVGGIRYTRDNRDFSGCSADSGVGDTSALYDIIARGRRAAAGLPPLAPIAPGVCVTLSTATFEPGLVRGNLDEDNVSFRTGLNFKPTSNSLLYASFSRGFKSGSFPTLGAPFALSYEPAKQEQVDAIEVGFKIPLFDNRMRLNGAAFHYDYTDKQLRGRIVDQFLGSLSKLVNIPESEIRGGELEMVWAPIPGLTINGAVSYIETEIKEFVGVNLFAQTVDFAGQTLNYTPPWSVNFGTEYTWPISDALDAFVGGDLAFRSRTSAFLGRDPDVDITDYTTVDLRAGVKGETWTATVWSNNVTDEYYWNAAIRGSDGIARSAAKPRTYGVLVSWKY